MVWFVVFVVLLYGSIGGVEAQSTSGCYGTQGFYYKSNTTSLLYTNSPKSVVNDTDFTMFAYIQADTIPDPIQGQPTYYIIVSNGDNERGMSLGMDQDRYLTLFAGLQPVCKTTMVKVASSYFNRWQGIYVKKVGNTVTFGYNNITDTLTTCSPSSFKLLGPNASVRIGGSSFNTTTNITAQAFLGLIGEVQIYNSSLSPTFNVSNFMLRRYAVNTIGSEGFTFWSDFRNGQGCYAVNRVNGDPLLYAGNVSLHGSHDCNFGAANCVTGQLCYGDTWSLAYCLNYFQIESVRMPVNFGTQGGGLLTVIGASFSPGSRIRIGNSAVFTMFVNSTMLITSIPAGVGQNRIRVEFGVPQQSIVLNNDGGEFYVTYAPPVISNSTFANTSGGYITITDLREITIM